MALADAIADLQDAVDLAKTIYANWVGTYSGILSSQLGAPSSDSYGRLKRQAIDAVGGWRRRFAAMISSMREDIFIPVLDEIALQLNRADVRPGASPRTILLALRDYMVANAKVFESRAVTHNAVSSITSPLTSGSDVALLMHTADDQATADTLEAVTADTLKFECIATQGEGRDSGNELFRVSPSVGQPARDILENGAIRNSVTMEVISAATALGLVNANFGQAFVGSGVDKIPGWTFSSGETQVIAETGTVFRGSQGLRANGAFLLKQTYAALPPGSPVIYSVRYRRNTGSGTGTLKARLGGVNVTTGALSGISTGWQRLSGIAWPKRFSSSGFDFEVELDTTDEAISGYTLLGEAVVHPLVRIGGRYFIFLAGQTDPALGDYFTQATSITGTGLNKEWLHRMFGTDFELPHDASPSAGWEDPS